MGREFGSLSPPIQRSVSTSTVSTTAKCLITLSSHSHWSDRQRSLTEQFGKHSTTSLLCMKQRQLLLTPWTRLQGDVQGGKFKVQWVPQCKHGWFNNTLSFL